MNLFVDEIHPGNPESNKFFVRVVMNSLKDEKLGYTSDADVRFWMAKDEVNGLSLQQIHDLAIDRAFETLKCFSEERPSADVRSGFQQ
jgi:hypothetical protein